MARYLLLFLFVFSACVSGPYPGPDKQGAGTLRGAMAGAGAGAITGAQIGAASGPAAGLGAGLGAIVGGVQGFVQDQLEEDQMRLAELTKREREVAQIHRILADHYERRLELHPTRDIFPADLFFSGDEPKLSSRGQAVVRELAKLNNGRSPWSRLVIASYVKVKPGDTDHDYAMWLAEARAIALGNMFVRNGLEPRRIRTRAMAVDMPLLIDPYDHKSRYSQAIELIPVDN